ncbi:DUF1648 domain-containing protein [candidate division KSB1 bacterium]|nr:DUF1648 domain-containing protein [candidate division KSB1 bacterium]RQW07806.1 MAG: DUF1648 domain-containing protein [candidate division KSB1 bacterium]
MSKTVQKIDYAVPLSSCERAVGYLAAALIFLLFIATAKNFGSLPDIIPTDFDSAGKPDGWGSRWTIWLIPIVSLIISVILSLVNKFPQLINYPVKITAENGQRQYVLARMFLKTIRLAIVLIFCILQWYWLRVALGQASAFAPFFMPLLLALAFLPICLYLVLAIRARGSS